MSRCKKAAGQKDLLARYRQYTSKMSIDSSHLKYISANGERLSLLFREVKSKGGFYEVVARRTWGVVAKAARYLGPHSPFRYPNAAETYKEYARYLYRFERYLKSVRSDLLPALSPKLIIPAAVYTEANGYESLFRSLLATIPNSKLSLDLTRFSLPHMKSYAHLFVPSTLTLSHNVFTVSTHHNTKLSADADFDSLNEHSKHVLHRFELVRLPSNLSCLLKLVPREVQLRGTLDLQRLCLDNVSGPYLSLRVKGDLHYDGGLDSAGFSTVLLNMGPNPLEVVVLNSRNYKAFKELIGEEPLDNSKIWNYSLDDLIGNGIAASVAIQRAGDIVLLFPYA